MRIGRYPNLGVIWYWACVVGRDRRLVTVIDHAVPLPSNPASLEIRTDGLWADHNVETPFDHLSLGFEAFGLAHDDPAEVYTAAFGDKNADRLRPRVGARRRGLPLPRPPAPLRDPVPGARRDPAGGRDHRLRRLRPARRFLGPAGLVVDRLVLDGVPDG